MQIPLTTPVPTPEAPRRLATLQEMQDFLESSRRVIHENEQFLERLKAERSERQTLGT